MPSPPTPTADQPLAGTRIVITRASHQSAPLAQALAAAGAKPIEAPAITIVPPTNGGQPLDDALVGLERFTWVAFSSVNAIAATFARADRRGVRAHFDRADLRLAAVGPMSAARLAAEVGRPPDLVAPEASAASLAAVFADPSPVDHCLIPRAQKARPDLPEGLRERGWQVTAPAAYRTVRPDLAARLVAEVATADAVVFASPSAVKGHLAQLESHGRSFAQPDSPTAAPQPAVICIGATTAAAAEQLGLTVTAIASAPTPEAIVAAVEIALR